MDLLFLNSELLEMSLHVRRFGSPRVGDELSCEESVAVKVTWNKVLTDLSLGHIIL
jgi:hypothetical protein